MIHYGVTKTAQIALARGLAETAAGTGVTVNSVLPGPTLSEGVGTFLGSLAKQQGVTFRNLKSSLSRRCGRVPSSGGSLAGRGRLAGRLCVQSAGIGNHRRRAACRWRSRAVDPLKPRGSSIRQGGIGLRVCATTNVEVLVFCNCWTDIVHALSK